MRAKLLLVFIGFFGSIIAGSIASPDVKALDTTRDCDKYAVVRCGAMSVSEIKDNYSKGDNDKVFAAFGISKSDIGGDIRSGVVYRDGRVVVDGKTVANDATMAARNLGGSRISGTTASKLSVSNMGDNQTAFVKFDKNGEFEWAIMKPCGNPVSAKPVKKPKPTAACSSLTATSLSRTQYRLAARAAATNGATVSKYTFVVKDTSNQIISSKTVSTKALAASSDTPTLAEGSYTASVVVTTSLGDTSAADCPASFTVKPAPTQPAYACTGLMVTSLSDTSFQFKAAYELKDATVKTVTYVVTDTNGKELSRSASDMYSQTNPGAYSVQAILTVVVAGKEQLVQSDTCKASFTVPAKESPCPIPGKENLPADSPECKEIPVQLPETGMIDMASKLIGLVALTGTSAYFLNSKR